MPRAWQSLIPVSWLPLIEKSAPGSRALYSEELIALTGDYRVARAAYEEAVKQRPGRIVTLRQKTRLLADSRSLK
jgi:hypothetical protein